MLSLKNLVHISITIIAWIGIILDCYANFQLLPFKDVLYIILSGFSYFTIVSNVLVIAILTWVFFKPKSDSEVRKVLEFSALINIIITAVIYWVLLSLVWKVEGSHSVGSWLVHYIVPALYVTNWILFRPKLTMTIKEVIAALLVPVLYLVYILWRGLLTNFYPYPFVDISQIGYSQVLTNIFFIMLFFIFVTTLFAIINNRLVAKGKIVK